LIQANLVNGTLKKTLPLDSLHII